MGTCSTKASLPNNCLCVFLYTGINVGWCTVHACMQLLLGNCSKSELPPWWFVCVPLKRPLLLSRCKQGKILCCFRYQNCFFNRKHAKGWTWCYRINKIFPDPIKSFSFRLIRRIVLSPVGMNLGKPRKMHDVCTSCSLFQNTQRSRHISAYLLIATEQRMNLGLVAGRCSRTAFSLWISLTSAASFTATF